MSHTAGGACAVASGPRPGEVRRRGNSIRRASRKSDAAPPGRNSARRWICLSPTHSAIDAAMNEMHLEFLASDGMPTGHNTDTLVPIDHDTLGTHHELEGFAGPDLATDA